MHLLKWDAPPDDSSKLESNYKITWKRWERHSHYTTYLTPKPVGDLKTIPISQQGTYQFAREKVNKDVCATLPDVACWRCITVVFILVKDPADVTHIYSGVALRQASRGAVSSSEDYSRALVRYGVATDEGCGESENLYFYLEEHP